ncbi:MAG: nucleotidyltransferase family protein, partial [Tabrizicola sp.]|nr:nucleotidyltransferase family protein [Tabrizicola sp.]
MDFGIGSQQVLLLKAALCQDKAVAAEALDRWWTGVADFDQVRGTDANLFPQVYWNLGSQIRDATLRARLKGTARHHWVRNQYLIANGGQLLDSLSRAGVPVLLLKGAAIASTVDDDLGLRTMSDCDLLVPKSRAIEVIDILARSDLLEPGRIDHRDLDVIHGITLALRKNRHANFDLHWRPLRLVGATELAEEMYASARPAAFAGRPCLAPCPEHLVFHAIAHGFEWSPWPRYDWLIDAIKVLRRTAGSFDWDKLAASALRYRFGYMVGAALEEGRAKAGIDVPDAVLRRLRRPFSALERLEARTRLASTPRALDTGRVASGAPRHPPAERARPAAPAAERDLDPGAIHARPLLRQPRFHPQRPRGTDHPVQGWSAPELGGRWTDGKLVSCALYAPDGARPTSLSLRAKPFAHRATTQHVVEVSAGWRRLGTMRWRKSGVGPYAQEVRLPSAIWRNDTAVLRFRIRKPASPIETGLNGDTRALGIFVQHISMDPAPRDIAQAPIDLSSSGSDHDLLWQRLVEARAARILDRRQGRRAAL